MMLWVMAPQKLFTQTAFEVWWSEYQAYQGVRSIQTDFNLHKWNACGLLITGATWSLWCSSAWFELLCLLKTTFYKLPTPSNNQAYTVLCFYFTFMLWLYINKPVNIWINGENLQRFLFSFSHLHTGLSTGTSPEQWCEASLAFIFKMRSLWWGIV